MGKLTYEEVVERCNNVHNNKYSYPIDFLDNKDEKRRVRIICPEHGEFWQTLSNHYKGCGCPKCGGNHRRTSEEYIEFLKTNFDNGKLLFDKVVYVNKHTSITIGCVDHGYFNLYPVHKGGNIECPICQKERLSKNQRKTTKEFLKQAKSVHGDKYDYSKTEYTCAKEKLCIICHEHGEFWQLPHTHLKGSGCPQCSKSKLWLKRPRMNKETFIEKAKDIHGNKYEYSQVNYIDTETKVCIVCKKHGEFWQSPYMHLKGCGCHLCNHEKQRQKYQLSKDEFINKARKIHGNKFDYSKVKYINYKTKVEIICPKHGSFWQTPSCHFKTINGCPTCKGELSSSQQENEIYSFLQSFYNGVIETNNRQIIPPLELDFYLPFENIAIEYNGLYWHSQNKIDKNYHLKKTEQCIQNGIRLIHIFEDEWIYKKDIVKSRLKNILGVTENKIFARKCEIKLVESKEARQFLETNHIQGHVNAKHRYGLYYNDELVTLMTFGQKRKSLGSVSKEGEYELLRFCNKLDTTVVGGASRLLKHFIKELKPHEIISYCDRRWSDGNLYKQLGFSYSHTSKPNYFYIINGKRENRFKYRKSELVKQGFDANKTEFEIMKERGIKLIYDCGAMVFEVNYPQTKDLWACQ